MNRTMRQKLTPAEAVHKHERALHKGQPLTPMKHGGEVMRKKSAMAKMPSKPKHPVTPSAAPMAKGGRACMAAGGVAKIRHKQATSAGKPLAPKGRFTEKLI